MSLVSTNQAPAENPADALVVGLHAKSAPGKAFQELDRASDGLLNRLLEGQELTGKAGELVALLAPPGIRARQVLVAGLGETDKFDAAQAFKAAAAAARRLADKPRQRVAFYLADKWGPEVLEAGLAGSLVGCVGQDLYRKEKKLHTPAETAWSGVEESVLRTARILADSMNLTRRLVNEPPSAMYPQSFAEAAAATAEQAGMECEVWDKARLEAEKCGALLAVARGSAQPPRLVILRHAGGSAEAPWLALVGKGVTFDSGGLSIKPTDGMKTMKCDMAGAATVLGTMNAIARLQLPINVIGLMGLVENMLSGESYKLGDVLRARSGKTIEVLNTDAEGRIVLADVLNVAVEHKAAKIVDLATLTGACVVALGNDVAGLMTNDQAWCDQVSSAARACGERVWQLPMFAEFGDQIRSEVADIKNVGDGRWGGAITAAKFLEEFVEGVPWVHMDIAGPAFAESAKPWLDAGGTGVYVRTLVALARKGV